MEEGGRVEEREARGRRSGDEREEIGGGWKGGETESERGEGCVSVWRDRWSVGGRRNGEETKEEEEKD